MVNLPVTVEEAAVVTMETPPVDIVKQRLTAVHDEAARFGQALQSVPDLKLPEIMPLATYDVHSKRLVVYPNLGLSMSDIVSGVMNDKSLDLFRTRFYGDLAVTMRAKRWTKPDTMLNKKEETSIAKYIRGLPSMADAKDDQVRDIAQRLENFFVEPSLIFAETDEQYFDMMNFKHAACMAVGTYSHIGAALGEKFAAQKLWPSVWYKYCPQVQGVYIQKNGGTVARGFLYKTDPDKDWDASSRAYASTHEFGQMWERLIKKNYPKAASGQIYSIKIVKPWLMPAYEIEGKPYAPVIQNDYIKYDFGICYMPGQKAFAFGPLDKLPKGARGMGDGYSTKGFVAADAVFNYDGTFEPK